MFQAVTVMFCGPHCAREGVLFHRIDHAIRVALTGGLPLLVAGDANRGRDVLLFVERASRAGVADAEYLYDGDAYPSTLNDARMTTEKLTQDPRFLHVHRVHFVTDDWHMARALAMFERTLQAAGHILYEIIQENVLDGPRPSREILDLEQQGLEAFKNGSYGGDGVRRIWGKPIFTDAP